MRMCVKLALASTSLMAMATPAFAQSTDQSDETLEEIIVTGTLIRGTAPIGTDVVAVNEEKIQASGASTTAQLLQTVPQLTNFAALQFPAGGGNSVTVNRPNLRSLPGFNTSGSSTTLVMLDGHRIVGMGISSTTPDPDIIPPGVISRLEIVPDGGSAIYGSDAVAGVMNFITRKGFDGVEVNARTGFADNYQTFDASGTVGRAWDSGSIFASYAYSQHDAIFGRDRDFVRTFPTRSTLTATGPETFTALTCAPGNVVIGGTSLYGLPYTTGTAAAAAGQANQCDLSDDATFYPKEHHHSLMAGLDQDLSPALSVSVRGYYFQRDLDMVSGAYTATKSANASTAGFASHRVGSETTHSVSFAWGGPVAQRQSIDLNSWGVTSEFTVRPGADWRIRLLGNYGESDTESHAGLASGNDNALNAALAAGLFNPYDPEASNPAALAAINNWETFGKSRQQLTNFRVIADGSLLSLPGGAVKLAAGLEYLKEGFVTTKGDTIPGFAYSGFDSVVVNGTTLIAAQAGRPRFNLSRDVKSAFGELVVPLFGADNATTMFRELSLSLSGRYDDYSDVGDTFNPKIGVTYRPVEGIRLRGSWGKSFNAPSLADSADAALTTGTYIGPLGFLPGFLGFLKPPANLVANGTYPAPGNFQTVLLVGGNSPGIQPQKAKTLSLGADIEPPFIPGLRFGATYWRIALNGRIGLAPFFDQNLWWNSYGSKITISPTDQQIADALAIADTTSGSKCQFGLTTNCVYALMDTRKTNLGNVRVSGLDFYANYMRETGFGSVDFAWNGSYELTRKESPAAGVPYSNQLAANFNRFRFSAALGADISNLRAQVTWNFRQGYDLSPLAGLIEQAHVGDFHVFNLFFRYDVKGEGALSDLAFTLNVDNVFDQAPPVDWSTKSTATQAGFGNGSTLGRLVQFGISKKF